MRKKSPAARIHLNGGLWIKERSKKVSSKQRQLEISSSLATHVFLNKWHGTIKYFEKVFTHNWTSTFNSEVLFPKQNKSTHTRKCHSHNRTKVLTTRKYYSHNGTIVFCFGNGTSGYWVLLFCYGNGTSGCEYLCSVVGLIIWVSEYHCFMSVYY